MTVLTPRKATAELPELCRVCVLPDARAKATFSDNTILITNSAGSSFVVLTPDGRSTRQLSEYALTRHSPLLAAVLEFRNMHVELPCICKPLAKVLRSSFTLGYIIHDATWPNPQHALEAGLAELQPDGKVVVSSEDGVAQVVLHGHHRRFAVCYPLLVAERPQEAKYEYVWQTQVFSVASHPARWQPAVRAALLAAAHLGQDLDAALTSCQQGQEQLAACEQTHHLLAQDSDPVASFRPTEHTALDLTDPHTTGPGSSLALTGGASDRRTPLPRADDCVRAGLTEQLRSDGWWAEPSLSLLPPEEVLMFEWTPHATYQFLPEAGEVEVWVHADESCMATARGGRFLSHHKGVAGPGGAEGAHGTGEQLYAANCVPEAVWSRDQACRYPLGALAAHALKLRSHNTTVAAAIAARLPSSALGPQPPRHAPGIASTSTSALPASASPDELFAVASTAVLEQSCVPGHGQFTAYQDGRVRAAFDDRAVLQLSASHSHAKVLLPDGAVVVVATGNPVGVEAYVAAALEFAAWAFKTPAERAAELRAQARVRAEILNSQRMAQVCEYTATGALPPSVGGHGVAAGAGAEDVAEASAGGMLPLHGAPAGGVTAPPPGMGEPGSLAMDRQAMIEEMLRANARLLERL